MLLTLFLILCVGLFLAGIFWTLGILFIVLKWAFIAFLVWIVVKVLYDLLC